MPLIPASRRGSRSLQTLSISLAGLRDHRVDGVVVDVALPAGSLDLLGGLRDHRVAARS